MAVREVREHCPNGGVNISADRTFTITVNAVNDAPVAAGEGVYRPGEHEDHWLDPALTGGITDLTLTNGTADSLSYDAQAVYFNGSGVTLTAESPAGSVSVQRRARTGTIST